MFKHLALAAAAATAFVAVPASAATTITFSSSTPGGNITLDPTGPGEEGGTFGFTVSGSGAFEVQLFFSNPFDPAKAGGSATFKIVDGDAINFTGADISGSGSVSFLSGPDSTQISVLRFGLGSGPQTLNIRGSLVPGGNGFATIGGQLSLAEVPEPATWALFILGFGAIGHTMRRRSSKVRVAKASLNFA